jgi:hypothetical protein
MNPDRVSVYLKRLEEQLSIIYILAVIVKGYLLSDIFIIFSNISAGTLNAMVP